MRRRFPENKLHFLWLIPLLILLSPIILILFLIEAFNSKKRRKEVEAFWTDNQDKLYFFYSNKNGWGDFVVNNIIPALPVDTSVYNIYRDKPNPVHNIYSIIYTGTKSWSTPRLPFIIKLTTKTPTIFGFHDDYAKIKKQSSKRDSSLQETIRQRVTEKLLETNWVCVLSVWRSRGQPCTRTVTTDKTALNSALPLCGLTFGFDVLFFIYLFLIRQTI